MLATALPGLLLVARAGAASSPAPAAQAGEPGGGVASTASSPARAQQVPGGRSYAGVEDTPPAPARASIVAPPDDTPRALDDAPDDAPPEPKLELTPGLRYWVRGNATLNDNFDRQTARPITDIRQQARLHLTARYGPVQAFVQFQDARLWGFEGSPVTNDANTDLHQGYLQLRGEDEASELWGELRVGRQEIPFGSRRLIAERPWNLVGQSFDAVRARGHFRRWELDGWFALTRTPETFTAETGALDMDGSPIERQYTTGASFIGGLQLTGAFAPGFNVTAQVLGERRQPQPTTPTETRDLVNGGLRILGEPIAGLHYDLELFVQGGEQRGHGHVAGAGLAMLDYTFERVKTTPTLHAGYVLSSGEPCQRQPGPGARCEPYGDSNEFWDFSARRHGYNGIADLALMRNMRNLELGGQLAPAKGLRFELTYHYFQLQDPEGAWWNTREQPVGAGWQPDNTQHGLGHELDFILAYQPWKDHFRIEPGYALFIPTAAGRRIGGGSDPRHFLYLLLLTQF